MAQPATAREQLFALRRQIARIEGRIEIPLEAPPGRPAQACAAAGLEDRQEVGATLLRRGGVAASDLAPLGAPAFDRALGGGVPRLGLTEIHAAAMRDAAATSGFALALVMLMLGDRLANPVLWIATGDFWRETGRPHAPGVAGRYGLVPENLLFAAAPRPVDALWVAEEAAAAGAFAAILVEIGGNPRDLDLTATRRLHRRALLAGQPILLLRAAAQPTPTAAPLRLAVSSAPSTPRRTLSGPLAGSIGPPAFHLAIGKSRTAIPATVTLEWSHGAFQERPPRAAFSGAVAPLPADGTDDAPAFRQIVAFAGARHAAAGVQPPREQYAAGDGARRAG